jgi:formate-dependent nitrite reductase cytochrome c552 subunit
MKKAFLFILFVAVMLIPFSASAEQATTIDELVAPYNSEVCADCHDTIHENWANSWHGKSIVDPRVLRTFRTFILSGLDKSQGSRKNFKDVCLGCHAPMTSNASPELSEKIADLVVTAVDDVDVAKKAAAIKELSKLNINCLGCHNQKGAADGNPQAKTIYAPGISEDEPPHKEEFGYDTVKTGYLKTSEFCASCHHGCPPDMPSSICPTLYSSYEEAYLANGGDKTCQDCHMRKGEDDEDSHKFPGIYEVDFAGEGIDIKLSTTPSQYVDHLANKKVPALVMNVQLTNTSGHGMPHG